MTLQTAGCLALAGAAGTLCRWALAELTARCLGDSFPWGTLLVNCLGSFVFGFVWSATEAGALFSNEARFVILTGFLGAFTTFSSFAFQTAAQLRDGAWWPALAYFAASNALCIGLVFAGIALGRRF